MEESTSPLESGNRLLPEENSTSKYVISLPDTDRCHVSMGTVFDDWILKHNSQERQPPFTVSNSSKGLIEDGDDSKINIGQEIDETCPELNVPSQNLPIQQSDLDTAAERLIPCIYKIPDELRVQKESAYKPRVVSIGPIHGNNERLNANEPIKLSYRDSLCSRILGDETMELCRSAMKDLEANVEKCYAEKVKLIIDEKKILLAEMMFIDGCFILELLYKYYSIEKKSLKRSIDDPVFSSLMKLLAIRHDLLLLENQIPFFVLEKLFSLTVKNIPDRPHNVSLTDYVLSFFGNNFSFGNHTLGKKVKTSDYHILHLLHQCYLPNHDPWKGKGDEDEIEFPKKKFRFPCASDLDLAGVKFVVRTGGDMFNVKFDKPQGLLRWFHRARFIIPTLSVYDGTEPLLRNLIAFEQCCLAVPRHMTSYGFFMDTLINSAEDVKLLEKAEILHNYLGTSEEASDLFNICKEVVVGRFYFEETCEVAAKHCQEPWPRFMASLRRDYFANPWTGIAVFAAIFIFGLTIVQTFYTVAPFYKK
ncbi:UPF0481 protein [Camellia lanceoleosa]|uniref:UPF0481 protein n=1 Tax=Camellia lanceoleosa TaxID=1840588 RepID=A0ACC0GC11_9ERIC|nr:UPF0481 protein [Camellia lanceoleosa]